MVVLHLLVVCLCAGPVLVRSDDVDLGIMLSLMESRLNATEVHVKELSQKGEAQALQIRDLEAKLNETTKELNAQMFTVFSLKKQIKDQPKVAFSASLGGNGARGPFLHSKVLVYRDVITNIGKAYNPETGIFTVPVKGVYYIRFTANAETDHLMSSVLYKNDELMLIVHEQPSGAGSDTASNGATFLLEEGDKLYMSLWADTHIWDNANRHSTFSGFLLFPM
ncbi:Complement C1q tumor necrosis factor-related protein 4-like [Scleropages formosus]|uniref:Complement C1q tumor necrosis factor-related protein 4-like n=1 Tax=Scleropages formosus TaxID=113540 RepID=A0A0P7TYW7_SCLFO|nr:complement C1q-like protein 2 [Scleropages formosus]KPP62930.1 Complement C1q tumor necrosis factor-related protein 4-like [Scleropages formosus]